MMNCRWNWLQVQAARWFTLPFGISHPFSADPVGFQLIRPDMEDARNAHSGHRKDKGASAMTETVERMAVVMKAQRHLRIVSSETTPCPKPARMAEPEKRIPRTEQKALVREICAGIRAHLDAVPFK